MSALRIIKMRTSILRWIWINMACRIVTYHYTIFKHIRTTWLYVTSSIIIGSHFWLLRYRDIV